MHITARQIEFTQQHQFKRSEQHEQTVVRRELIPSENTETPTTARPIPSPLNTNAPLSTDLSAFRVRADQALLRLENSSELNLSRLDLNTSLLKALVEAMTGEKIETSNKANEVTANNQTNTPLISVASTTEPTVDMAPPAIFETTTTTLSSIQEYEYSNVSIAAALTNDQGELLNINVSFTMERSYQQENLSIDIRQGPLTDPLVINLNGSTASLSSEPTYFDLDNDGIKESIASLNANSAYLALDNDGDGAITNGSELFGPTTTNGFAELAVFDEDGNGFIDGNDSIFSQLLLYRPSDGHMTTLQNHDIGAIFTGSVNSPFNLTDSQNNLLGKVRSSGFYLTENGVAGAVQQIDLVV